MPDLFEDGVTDADFALPGDDALAAQLSGEPERPRDDQGRFVAQEQQTEEAPAEEPQAEAQAEAQTEAQAEAEKLLAGNFKNVGELERAYEELRSRFGQQGSELGELRKALEERFETLEQRLPAQEEPRYNTDELAEWFEANPTQIPQIAVQAAQQGRRDLYAAALSAWKEHDEAAASSFDREVLKAELRAELTQTQTETQEVTSSWNSVAAEFGRTHADLEKFAPAMQEEAKKYEAIIERTLREGNAEEQMQVLDFLYEKARRQETDNVVAVAQEAARETAVETDRAIAEATVASATVAHRESELTPADKLAAQWDAMDAPFADWHI